MLYLALLHRPEGAPRVIAAARNVHKAYVYAAALLDFETLWLWPEETDSLCACPVTPESLDRALSRMDAPRPPFTSPARTIWGIWRILRACRRSAMLTGRGFSQTTPMEPTCAF